MSDELMPASEARRIVDELLDERAIKLKAKITAAIKTAVANGRRTATIEVDASDQERIIEWLASLGYEIKPGRSDYRGESWITITW